MDHLRLSDPEIYEAIVAEEHRQRDELELIASENYTSLAVMEAVGSVLTNKYAEGLPGRRYYGGCQHVDVTERLAIERAKTLFGAQHVNVQPHSGATANQAVYYAALEVGDTVLAMDLAQGGHLTHGMKLNFSGRWYPTVGYGVDPKTERIDIDADRPTRPRAQAEADPRGGERVSARHRLRRRSRRSPARSARSSSSTWPTSPGLVAGGEHPSPVPFADFVTTTTHKTLRGPRGGVAMCRADWSKKLDSAVFPGLQGGPLEHVIAGKAVCFGEALRPDFKAYARQVVVNAATLAEELTRAGLPARVGGDG